MIEPKYYTLNSLFGERVFRIPHYQRFYSWQSKQLKDLFDDLIDLHAKGGDRHHFMATLVCFRTTERMAVKTIDYSVYEVVDGQQRITTLAILLRAIEQKIDDSDVRQELCRILVKDDANLLLLQTNNSNQHLFNRYIREAVIPSKDETKTHADANLTHAIREINVFLSQWQDGGKDLLGLLRLLRNRIGFVVYDTEDKLAVYSIFESLNSRGLAVDWLDKAKSMLMGVAFEKSQSPAAAEAKIEELHSLWAKVYDELARHSISGQEILRVATTLHLGAGTGKPLSSEDSIDKLRDYCDSPEKTVEVTEWFRQVAEKLVSLHTRRYWGPVTRILQVRVLALAIMLADYLTDRERECALDQWERVSFRIYGLYRKDSRTKVGDYIRLAAAIMKRSTDQMTYDDLMKMLRELGSDHPVKFAVDELVNSPRYEGFEDECRYILWRFEEFLAQEEGAHVNKELREKIWNARSAAETIEHIYPQAADKNGPWFGKLNKGEHQSKHIDRIGNLMLLPPGLNSEAGRKAFVSKKDVYKKAEGLRMVRAVLSKRDWNQKSIETREKEIVRFLLDKFSDLE